MLKTKILLNQFKIKRKTLLFSVASEQNQKRICPLKVTARIQGVVKRKRANLFLLGHLSAYFPTTELSQISGLVTTQMFVLTEVILADRFSYVTYLQNDFECHRSWLCSLHGQDKKFSVLTLSVWLSCWSARGLPNKILPK